MIIHVRLVIYQYILITLDNEGNQTGMCCMMMMFIDVAPNQNEDAYHNFQWTYVWSVDRHHRMEESK